MISQNNKQLIALELMEHGVAQVDGHIMFSAMHNHMQSKVNTAILIKDINNIVSITLLKDYSEQVATYNFRMVIQTP